MIKIASVLIVGMTITAAQASAAPRLADRFADSGLTARAEVVRCAGRHCRARVYGYRSYGYSSGWHSQDPSHLRIGTRRWWDAMDRQGRGGRR
jgi:hypothetical protein